MVARSHRRDAGEPAALNVVDHTVVVIDVLRATSTIVEALVNGAKGVYPAAKALLSAILRDFEGS